MNRTSAFFPLPLEHRLTCFLLLLFPCMGNTTWLQKTSQPDPTYVSSKIALAFVYVGTMRLQFCSRQKDSIHMYVIYQEQDNVVLEFLSLQSLRWIALDKIVAKTNKQNHNLLISKWDFPGSGSNCGKNYNFVTLKKPYLLHLAALHIMTRV